MAKLLVYIYSESEEIRADISRRMAATGLVDFVAAPCHLTQLEEILTTAELDVIYVDLGETPDAVLEVLERAPQPRPAFVMGGGSSTPEVLLRAMRLQPRDFCVDHKVRDMTALLTQIGVTSSRRHARRKERRGTLAVAGAKGGVGTTMVACELASALQLLGDRVVVMDLNLYMGDVALYFDLKPPYTITDISKKGDALDQTFISTAIATHLCGVRVLAAPNEVQDIAMIGSTSVLRAIQLLREEYDWVILDLPHAWEDVSLRALDLADQILLVTNLDVPSLRHTRHQLDLLETFGAAREQVRIIVNKHTRSGTLLDKEIDEFLGRKSEILIPIDEAVTRRCTNEGKLIRDVGRGSKLEKAFSQLAELACEWQSGETVAKPKPQGLLARLRSMMGT